jgi:hypothetical protein
MTRITLTLLPTLASLVLAATAVGATQRSTFTLALPATKSTYVDLGRHGYSAGDYFVSTGRLLDGTTRKPAGRLAGTRTILSRQGDYASFVLGLHGGTIFVAGRITHTAPASRLAVTGGTGRYRDARGTLTFRYTSRTSADLDVRLR